MSDEDGDNDGDEDGDEGGELPKQEVFQLIL